MLVVRGWASARIAFLVDIGVAVLKLVVNRREQNKLKPTQAQTVIAAALLRQPWAVVTSGKAWDPARAANGLIGIQEANVA